MGYQSNSTSSPGGEERDVCDHAKLRHGRMQSAGSVGARFLMPAPMLFSRDGHNVFLGDMYRGGHAFLICGGPSLTTHDLSLLQQRGIITCAVNNAATIVRSNLWISVDDPGNFSDSIWRDPAITKFVPLCHMEKPFSERNDAGELIPSRELVGDMPAVFGFRRNEAFVAEQYLYEDTINWGNHGQRTDAYGIRGCRSVMLAAIRLLFHLGIRSIYLLGCDFKMQYGANNYAFPQDRSRASVNGNNKTFEALDVRFAKLLPYFAQENLSVYNCTPGSMLTAFPHLEYGSAISKALATFPKSANTVGMYDRKQKETNKPSEFPTSANSATDSQPRDITLFSTVDHSNESTLLENWKTWMKFNPWLRQTPAVVLCHRVPAPRLERLLRQHHATVQCKSWEADESKSGREAWGDAWLRFVAREVATEWFLKIEPEAVATRPEKWLKAEWLRPGPTGKELAFIAPRWGYSKPSQILDVLNDWADNHASLRSFSRLNVGVSGDDRVYHDAISSWLLFGNTRWFRELEALVPEGIPCQSFDTFIAFYAARRGDHFVRWPLKEHGWNHSFRHQRATNRTTATRKR